MLAHHLITSSLIWISYVYRFTRVGIVVLCLMDVVDLIFPVCLDGIKPPDCHETGYRRNEVLTKRIEIDRQNAPLPRPRNSMQHNIRPLRHRLAPSTTYPLPQTLLGYLHYHSFPLHHAIRLLRRGHWPTTPGRTCTARFLYSSHRTVQEPERDDLFEQGSQMDIPRFSPSPPDPKSHLVQDDRQSNRGYGHGEESAGYEE